MNGHSVLFKSSYVPTFLQLLDKKVLNTNGPYLGLSVLFKSSYVPTFLQLLNKRVLNTNGPYLAGSPNMPKSVYV